MPGTHEMLESLFTGHDCRLLDLSRAAERPAEDEAEDGDTDERELSLQEHFLAFYRKQTGRDDPSTA